jgi:GTP-binding protein Era
MIQAAGTDAEESELREDDDEAGPDTDLEDEEPESDPDSGEDEDEDPTGGMGAVGENFRSGFVTVVGLPNAGKSTLINAFVGRAALITSYRPQTTRNQIRCIVTDKDRQVIFVDTPGFIPGKAVFDKTLRQEIYKGKEDVDVLLYVIDATRPNREKNRNAWKALTRETRAKKVLVLNKIDRFSKVELIPILSDHLEAFSPDELVPVSAKDQTNLAALDRVITASMPRGPMLYPEDIVVDRPTEFLLSEFVWNRSR